MGGSSTSSLASSSSYLPPADDNPNATMGFFASKNIRVKSGNNHILLQK